MPVRLNPDHQWSRWGGYLPGDDHRWARKASSNGGTPVVTRTAPGRYVVDYSTLGDLAGQPADADFGLAHPRAADR
ncbi:hypothetical protein FHS29_001153 [Saccharothrix tamanrassetensis]|uniref:Uncharacterized protein n=1 Tax=Saccharothrix tamanrassetensis TaxID=1051531 RepID=A0A841CCA8_9PSEU|nr:hypothetical protein [Saccharothrix tamanrassetensis]MBB5954583.1 hypothetical protein [Saccharothrix tamanrassetensis]